MIEIIPYKGKSLMGFKQDHLFNELKKNEFVDTFLLNPISKYVNKDSIVLDIGANLGYVSIHLSSLCKKVLAFEPQKETFMILNGNLALQNCWNVEPINCALYSKDTRLSYSAVQDGWTGTQDPSKINEVKSFGSISFEPKQDGDFQAFKLDTFNFQEAINFIKIDCEGADIDVLLGAEELVKRDHPIICLEFSIEGAGKHGRKFSDIEDFARKNGYKLNQLAPGNYILE